jgi:hypothetical protein
MSAAEVEEVEVDLLELEAVRRLWEWQCLIGSA